MMCIILCYKSNIHFYAQLSFILNIVGENTIGYSTSCDILLKNGSAIIIIHFIFFLIKCSKQVQTEHFIKIHVQNPISPLPPFIFYLTRFPFKKIIQNPLHFLINFLHIYMESTHILNLFKTQLPEFFIL